jgi:hypothetical protein
MVRSLDVFTLRLLILCGQGNEQGVKPNASSRYLYSHPNKKRKMSQAHRFAQDEKSGGPGGQLLYGCAWVALAFDNRRPMDGIPHLSHP